MCQCETTMNELPTSAARQRILDKAEELFYKHGYRATGINQIIAESGVAKATFYAHFKSKDDLCLAYLEQMREKERAALESEIAKRRSPLAKYLALVESVEPWLLATDFRGCAFLNMVPEVPDFKSAMRQVGAEYYAHCGTVIERQVEQLIASDSAAYGTLNPKRVAADYMTIFSGAIALCEINNQVEPLRRAVRMIKELVEKR